MAPVADEDEKKQQLEANEDDEESLLPPQDRGWRAYTFVAAGMLLDANTWGLTFAWSRYQSYYSTHPPFEDDSQVAIAATGSIQLALLYAGLLLGTQMCRRWPHLVRRGMWLALCLFQLSLVIASFANNVAMLIIFQGFFASLFSTLAYAPLYLYLSEWFVKWRATAGAIIFAGAGVGGLIYPIILNPMLDKLGFRWTLRILALVGTVLCSIALLGLQPRKKPVKPDRSQKSSSYIKWGGLLEPLFLSNCTSVFIQGCFYSPISVYISPYTATIASPSTSGYVLAVLNAATIPGQITVGGLCDRMTYTYVQIASGVLSTILVFGLLRVAETSALIYVFAALTGWLGGGYTSSWFPASIDSAGDDPSQAGPIFGFLAFVRGVSAVFSPILAGLLYNPADQESTQFGKKGLGHFVLFVGFMAVGTVVSASLTEILRWLRRRTQPRKVVQ